jgi:hypothetical protein
MQEFSSVTASSYDADSLAPLLSEKSAEGWDVISIVSAGTNIVAYLSRDVSSDEEDTGEIDTSAFGDTGADVAMADAVVAEAEIAEAEIEADVAADAEELADIQTAEDEIAVPTDTTPIAAAAVVAASDDIPQSEVIEVGSPADAVDEPAGWGAAPEDNIGTESASTANIATETAPAEASVEDLAAQVAEPEPAVAPVVAPVVEPEPEPEPVVETAPAAVESTVPAGWYADPSGRYELRYWDGTAWTEHVSRAGQQFTDPPVA